jgi:predicted nucleic acid-binding protein
MAAEIVVDASVAAKVCFFEEGSEAARALALSGVRLAAPDLLFVEMASVAAKRVRLGLEAEARGAAAVESVSRLVDLAIPLEALATGAFALAVRHGLSASDAAYLALAEERRSRVVTADPRLIERAQACGLGHLVAPLVP